MIRQFTASAVANAVNGPQQQPRAPQREGLVDKHAQPDVLDDKGATGFWHWAQRYKTLLGARDVDAKVALEWAEPQTVDIEGALISHGGEWMASQVMAALTIATRCEPLKIVMSCSDQGGLEAWRRLTARYDPSTAKIGSFY